jgi:hypothetical protein
MSFCVTLIVSVLSYNLNYLFTLQSLPFCSYNINLLIRTMDSKLGITAAPASELFTRIFEYIIYLRL